MKILDFSAKEKRYWGHDFTLVRKLDETGFKWLVSVWHMPTPEMGDCILMALNHNDVRAAFITRVEPAGNPPDQYFLTIDIKNAAKMIRASRERFSKVPADLQHIFTGMAEEKM